MNKLFETRWLEIKKALCEGRDMSPPRKMMTLILPPCERRKPDYLKILKDVVRTDDGR